MCLDYIGRITDNLLSNIRKYADPLIPIEISTLYVNHYVGIKIETEPLPAKAGRFDLLLKQPEVVRALLYAFVL